MFPFLLVVHALIAAALVAVILMQRSEGGGLGMGSGPSGLMTARGAADFLTRATGVLATLFVLMAFLIATLAARGSTAIDTSLAGQAPVGPITAPQGATANIPMMGTPTPAAPDPLTAQALAPASAGPPTKPLPIAEKQVKATKASTGPVPVRKRATVGDLKTIDPGEKAGTVGIGGIGTAKPAETKPAEATKPAPATTTPAPSLSPAPAAATGNSQ